MDSAHRKGYAMATWLSKRLVILLTMVALAALVLAACGGGDDDDDDGGDDTGPTATEADDSGDDGGDDDSGDDDDGGDDDSGDDDDGGSDGDVDVCSLLSDDEVSAVLGSAPEGEAANFDPFFDCSWITEDFNSINLSVAVGPGGESLFEFNNDDAEEIDGLGDRAQYLSGILGVLEVLEGDYYISVSVTGSDLDEDERRDASIELADHALGRLD